MLVCVHCEIFNYGLLSLHNHFIYKLSYSVAGVPQSTGLFLSINMRPCFRWHDTCLFQIIRFSSLYVYKCLMNIFNLLLNNYSFISFFCCCSFIGLSAYILFFSYFFFSKRLHTSQRKKKDDEEYHKVINLRNA